MLDDRSHDSQTLSCLHRQCLLALRLLKQLEPVLLALELLALQVLALSGCWRFLLILKNTNVLKAADQKADKDQHDEYSSHTHQSI